MLREGPAGLRDHGMLRLLAAPVVKRPRHAEAVVAYDLEDGRGLAPALDPHEVQPAAEEPSALGQGTVRCPRADHAHAVVPAQAVQPAGEVHGVAHATELHLRVAADVPGEHAAAVDAHVRREGRQAATGELHVEQLHGALLRQRRLTGSDLVLRKGVGRVPKNEQAVVEDLRDGAAIVLHDVRHDGVVPPEDPQEILLRERGRDTAKVPEAAEHHGDVAPVHM
mmetsp:Transcript_90253/g.292061  ORF Transcript_90253/g.292061 Transcript_90253/m.292061 type:complete len:224 (-) Transcript_90253:1334-2005(-)